MPLSKYPSSNKDKCEASKQCFNAISECSYLIKLILVDIPTIHLSASIPSLEVFILEGCRDTLKDLTTFLK